MNEPNNHGCDRPRLGGCLIMATMLVAPYLAAYYLASLKFWPAVLISIAAMVVFMLLRELYATIILDRKTQKTP